MLGLWDTPTKTEEKAMYLSRLMFLPSKCTDIIFIFRALINSAQMDSRTMNLPLFTFIPKISVSESRNGQCTTTSRNVRQRYLIMMLLLLAGINPNPGPAGVVSTPLDFSNRSGLRMVHLNVRSLLPKLDQLHIWAKMTKADVLVISETWLKKSISSHDIALEGYNVFRADRKSKGGGVAMYIKSNYHVTVLKSVSFPKQFELLAIDLEYGKDCHLCIVGCYRPPAAISDALTSLLAVLNDILSKDLVLLGDLNWNWLTSNSDQFKAYCDSVNFTQLIESPTRLNLKNPSKSTLIDLILTNKPHKYTYTGVFPDDVSDHCTIAVIRNCKIPKVKPRIITKRNFKLFDIQGFLHELFASDWDRLYLIPDVSIAWQYFHTLFLKIVNRHAPVRTFSSQMNYLNFSMKEIWLGPLRGIQIQKEIG